MEDFTSIQCPFCGQTFEVTVDTTIPNQCFTTDCEICCRPIEIKIECCDGEIIVTNAA